MFAAAFPGEAQPLDFAHAARAIAAFEAALVSRGSPFDHGTLFAGARQGQALFRRDCAGCHSGADFTDLRFHRLGAPDPAASDQGLFEATGREADRALPHAFAAQCDGNRPWWHDGSAPSVEAAIARHGKAYPAAQQASLLAFLAALTDRAFMANPAFALPQQACGKAL
jgi:cytochrome c peroxidase